MFLIAEFRAKDSLVNAILAAKKNGIPVLDIDIFSEEPVELKKGILDRPSHMSKVAVAGAVLFGTLATSFVYFAQHDYPVVTGGMPIFSFWATGIITYEMTMLGAIFATFFWFLWESGLIRRRHPAAPVPQTGPASMCLRVRCDDKSADAVLESMRAAGAIRVDRKV
ncbi:MAG TPA: quinol:electron acceptor oxidoreductase subunit ActD [Bryobacteraceae bacterium]|nr:quinol:electron acceptor oxidoreductase subunit ActD [Bryobacteraceae bacterium]